MPSSRRASPRSTSPASAPIAAPSSAAICLWRWAGRRTDGAIFVPTRARRGARAREAPGATPLPEGVAFIKVDDARRALALTAAKFFSRQPQVIAAVTGTSGKTSVAAFTRQIWAAHGHAAASIGTVGLVSPKREVYGSL